MYTCIVYACMDVCITMYMYACMYLCIYFSIYLSVSLSIYRFLVDKIIYSLNTQLGGVQIRYNNGITHLTVRNDYKAIVN